MKKLLNKRQLFDLLFWPMLILLGILSIIAILRSSLHINLLSMPFDELNTNRIFFALILQTIVLILAIFSWQYNLKHHGLAEVKMIQSMAMIGINAIGKYTPGKIWGMFARGAALLKISSDKQLVILATFVEQIALFHSGVVLAYIAYSEIKETFIPMAVVIIGGILSVYIVSRSARLLIRFKMFLNKKKEQEDLFQAFGFKTSYFLVFTFSSLMWLLSALALYFCITSYSTEIVISFSEILWITASSYLAGFLAIFSLAGLGVREGVMVMMLSPHMDVSAAVYISVIHRLVTVVPDVTLGLIAFLSSKRFLENKEA